MTRFEEIGTELQQLSRTIEDADRRFDYSCEKCCSYGLRIQCDACAIDAAHSRAIATLPHRAEFQRPRPSIRVWRAGK